MAARPDAVGLFDASMPEPTELLGHALRDVMEAPGRPRVRSVMGPGNRRVVEALAHRYGVVPSQVLCTAGALSAVAVTLKALLGTGGRLLLEERAVVVLNGHRVLADLFSFHHVVIGIAEMHPDHIGR